MRILQQMVCERLGSQVLLLPIATDIQAVTSLGTHTAGMNHDVGYEPGAAALTFKDFALLTQAEDEKVSEDEKDKLDRRGVAFLVAAHYRFEGESVNFALPACIPVAFVVEALDSKHRPIMRFAHWHCLHDAIDRHRRTNADAPLMKVPLTHR